MMTRLICCILVFTTLSASAQTKTERQWADIYTNQEWKATHLISLAEYLNFRPAGLLKGLSLEKIKLLILKLPEDAMRQTNIFAAYQCSVRHEEAFMLWNLQYPKINREQWDKYCKGMVALMYLDGILEE